VAVSHGVVTGGDMPQEDPVSSLVAIRIV
jgi:hypothetical protein